MIEYFEEIEVGQQAMLGGRRFTAEDIKAYASRFDPQPFHVDEEAGRNSLFGGLCASGWQTIMMCAKLTAERHRRQSEARRAAGGAVAALGPVSAIRELKWLKPVFPGDVITYAARVTEKREAAADGFGIVVTRNTGVNQGGEVVISFLAELLVERRPD